LDRKTLVPGSVSRPSAHARRAEALADPLGDMTWVPVGRAEEAVLKSVGDQWMTRCDWLYTSSPGYAVRGIIVSRDRQQTPLVMCVAVLGVELLPAPELLAARAALQDDAFQTE
jgi:hypothetical protein